MCADLAPCKCHVLQSSVSRPPLEDLRLKISAKKLSLPKDAEKQEVRGQIVRETRR